MKILRNRHTSMAKSFKNQRISQRQINKYKRKKQVYSSKYFVVCLLGLGKVMHPCQSRRKEKPEADQKFYERRIVV